MSIEVVTAPDPDRAVTLLLNRNDEIASVLGPAKDLFRCRAEGLIQVAIEDLVTDEDVERLHRLLTTARSEKRQCRAFVGIQVPGALPFRVRVDCGPSIEDDCLKLTMVYIGATHDVEGTALLEPVDTGGIGTYSDLVEALVDLICRQANRHLQMTLVSLDEEAVGRLRQRFGRQAIAQIFREIEILISEQAFEGQGGQLGVGQFGLVHDRDDIQASVKMAFAKVATAHDIAIPTDTLSWRRIGLDRGILSDTAIFHSIDYILSRYLNDGIAAVSDSSISLTYQAMVDLSEKAMTAVRDRRMAHAPHSDTQLPAGGVGSGWHVHITPVYDVGSTETQFRDLAMLFELDGEIIDLALAAEIVQATDTVLETDCTGVDAAFGILADTGMQCRPLLLPLNADTVVSTKFMDVMEGHWRNYEPLAGSLHFTLQNVMAHIHNPAFQTHVDHLLSVGHTIGLDDFGAALVDLELIEQMGISYVRLDAQYTELLTGERLDNRLLHKLLGLWTRMGVTVIADGVAHEEQAAALARLGIRYGSGAYFSGRPTASADGAALDTTALPRGWDFSDSD